MMKHNALPVLSCLLLVTMLLRLEAAGVCNPRPCTGTLKAKLDFALPHYDVTLLPDYQLRYGQDLTGNFAFDVPYVRVSDADPTNQCYPSSPGACAQCDATWQTCQNNADGACAQLASGKCKSRPSFSTSSNPIVQSPPAVTTRQGYPSLTSQPRALSRASVPWECVYPDDPSWPRTAPYCGGDFKKTCDAYYKCFKKAAELGYFSASYFPGVGEGCFAFYGPVQGAYGGVTSFSDYIGPAVDQLGPGDNNAKAFAGLIARVRNTGITAFFVPKNLDPCQCSAV